MFLNNSVVAVLANDFKRTNMKQKLREVCLLFRLTQQLTDEDNDRRFTVENQQTKALVCVAAAEELEGRRRRLQHVAVELCQLVCHVPGDAGARLVSWHFLILLFLLFFLLLFLVFFLIFFLLLLFSLFLGFSFIFHTFQLFHLLNLLTFTKFFGALIRAVINRLRDTFIHYYDLSIF